MVVNIRCVPVSVKTYIAVSRFVTKLRTFRWIVPAGAVTENLGNYKSYSYHLFTFIEYLLSIFLFNSLLCFTNTVFIAYFNIQRGKNR